jgi:hypothetical protein
MLAECDLGFPEPVRSRFFAALPENAVVSGDCRVRCGMNDRFAIASAAPHAGAQLFTLPNQVFMGQSQLSTNVKVSEQFLKFVCSDASINMATGSDFRNMAKVHFGRKS